MMIDYGDNKLLVIEIIEYPPMMTPAIPTIIAKRKKFFFSGMSSFMGF